MGKAPGLDASHGGTAYLRLVIDAESASVHNTNPLEEAFGMRFLPSDTSLDEARLVDPRRIVHPVRATWSGRRSDILQGNVGWRNQDAVVSEAFFERLSGAHLAPHVEVPVLCAKADKWGIRVHGPEVPHRWIAWTRPNDLLDGVDWDRSTFVLCEWRTTADGGRVQDAPVVRSFRDRAEFEGGTKAAFEWGHVDILELAWRDPALAGLDMFTIPRVRVDVTYVSERIALALLRSPKLGGFKLFRSDGSTMKTLSRAK